MDKMSLFEMVDAYRDGELLNELGKVDGAIVDFTKKGYHLIEKFDQRVMGKMKELHDAIFEHAQKLQLEDMESKRLVAEQQKLQNDAILAEQKRQADLINDPEGKGTRLASVADLPKED